MNVRGDMHSRVTSRPDGMQLEAPLGVGFHIALDTRMADLAVRRIVAVLIGVVRVNDDSRDGVLTIGRKDAARDDQRIAGLSGRDNGSRPGCVRWFWGRWRRVLPFHERGGQIRPW